MTRRHSAVFLQAVALSFSCSLILGCGSRPNREAQQRDAERTKKLEAFQSMRDARAKDLKAMNVPSLAAELEKESQRGLEPFNSMAYAEMVSRGGDSALALAPLLTKPDRNSFLGLLAVRKLNSARYRDLSADFRHAVLLNSLESSTYFNAWGIPTVYWTEAAQAVIDEGPGIEPGLAKLLRDTRPAPVWGSEGVMINQQYHFRVADYAWALLNEIRGAKAQIPQDPQQRDSMIADTLKQISKGKK
jgi:hypothetical protein